MDERCEQTGDTSGGLVSRVKDTPEAAALCFFYTFRHKTFYSDPAIVINLNIFHVIGPQILYY